MERHKTFNVFIVALVISILCIGIEAQRGRQACRRCDQTVSGRNLGYGRALRIIQSEQYLEAADLDLIKKSSFEYLPTVSRFRRQLPDYLPLNYGTNVTVNADYRFIIPAAALIAGLFAALGWAARDRGTIIGTVPLDQPQPGTLGGGRLPLGNDAVVREARSLVPKNRAPVAVFPPFQTPRTYPAVAVIWDETPLHISKAHPEDNGGSYQQSYGYYEPEKLYGYRVRVTLVNEPCEVGVTCSQRGERLTPHYGYGSNSYAEERQLRENIRSDGPPVCRIRRRQTC